MSEPVHVGCSGWTYDDWRGGVYPEREPRRRWLELYAQRFSTAEVNATFYGLPERETVARWVAQTPPDFIFAVKASRYLTHIRRLTEIEDGIARFYERLEPLQASGRLGPVLWQLPPNFARDDGRLNGWLAALPGGRHTIEFRHPSWFCRPVLDALRDADVALTVSDHPESPVQGYAATASWRFVRLHYGARGPCGNYAPSELVTWAHRLAQWRRRAETYVYFNNDWKGFAPANAQFLARRLVGDA